MQVNSTQQVLILIYQNRNQGESINKHKDITYKLFFLASLLLTSFNIYPTSIVVSESSRKLNQPSDLNLEGLQQRQTLPENGACRRQECHGALALMASIHFTVFTAGTIYSIANDFPGNIIAITSVASSLSGCSLLYNTYKYGFFRGRNHTENRD